MKILSELKKWAKQIINYLHALFLAYHNPKVSVFTKLLIGAVLAYGLSPVDLIPDFIPVIGLLDDLVLLPVGIWLAIKCIPADIWNCCLKDAEEKSVELPKNYLVATIIIVMWLLLILSAVSWFI